MVFMSPSPAPTYELKHLVGTDMRGRYNVVTSAPVDNLECPDCGLNEWGLNEVVQHTDVFMRSNMSRQEFELPGFEYDCLGDYCCIHESDAECSIRDYDDCEYDACYRMITYIPYPANDHNGIADIPENVDPIVRDTIRNLNNTA